MAERQQVNCTAGLRTLAVDPGERGSQESFPMDQEIDGFHMFSKEDISGGKGGDKAIWFENNEPIIVPSKWTSVRCRHWNDLRRVQANRTHDGRFPSGVPVSQKKSWRTSLTLPDIDTRARNFSAERRFDCPDVAVGIREYAIEMRHSPGRMKCLPWSGKYPEVETSCGPPLRRPSQGECLVCSGRCPAVSCYHGPRIMNGIGVQTKVCGIQHDDEVQCIVESGKAIQAQFVCGCAIRFDKGLVPECWWMPYSIPRVATLRTESTVRSAKRCGDAESGSVPPRRMRLNGDVSEDGPSSASA